MACLEETKTMTGFEWEFFHPTINCIRRIQTLLGDDITRHCEVKTDQSPNDTQMFEIAFPPMNAFCTFTKAMMRMVEKKLREIGCQVNKNCGMHVHLSTRVMKDEYSATEFSQKSWKNFYNGNSQAVLDMVDMTSQMPLLGIKDATVRYFKQISSVNSILARSRQGNRFARTNIDINAIETATDYRNLALVHGNKFYAVNFKGMATSSETIEFRQHHATIEAEKTLDWIAFIVNLFAHSINSRITTSTTRTIETTMARPDANDMFRRGTAKNVIYSLIAREGGATTQEIMNVVSGSTAQNVRSRISEIRNRLGDQAVTTHTSQHYGYSYGASNGLYDLGGYSVPSEWIVTETQGDQEQYLAPNLIGSENVFYGLECQVYDRLIARFS